MKTQCLLRHIEAKHSRHPEAIKSTMEAVKSYPVDQKYIKTAADIVETAYSNTVSEYICSSGVAAAYVMRYTLQLVKEGKLSLEEV